MNNISKHEENDDFLLKIEEIRKLVISKLWDKALQACIILETTHSNKPELFFNFGKVYKNLGQISLAIKYYKKLLKVLPDHPDTINNLGNLLNHQGNVSEAITMFQKAIMLKPTAAIPYANLSYSFYSIGKYSEAIIYGKKAIELNPNLITAYIYIVECNLGLQMNNDALEVLSAALEIDPNNKKLISLFYKTLSVTKFTDYDTSLDKEINKLFRANKIDSNFNNLIDRIEKHPNMQRLLSYSENNDNFNDMEEILTLLNKIPNFLNLISIVVIKNEKIEFLLTKLRKIILMDIKKYDENENIIQFHQALTIQCYINDYKFKQSPNESKIIKVLEKELENSSLNNELLSSLKFLILGSYIKVGHLGWARTIQHSNNIDITFKLIVSDLLLEKAIIPLINKILPTTTKDLISTTINLYNVDQPNPKWIHNNYYPEKDLYQLLQTKRINLVQTQSLLSPQTILMTNCNTGKQSINMAKQFPLSRIIAIDTSEANLAYAIRKTKELGINNINYIYCNALDISELNMTFDIIELKDNLNDIDKKTFESLIKLLNGHGLIKIIANKNNNNNNFGISSLKIFINSLKLKFGGFTFDNDFSYFDFKKVFPVENSECSLDKWEEYEIKSSNIFQHITEFWLQKI